MSANFLLVDDHPLFLEALQLAVHTAFPAATIAEATSIASAKEALKDAQSFDLVLLDLSMPGTRGLDGLIELRAQFPRQPVVIVSALDDSRIVHEAMKIGAAGFIPKSTRKHELADAIRQVVAGAIYLPAGYQPPEQPAKGIRPPKDLSARIATLTPQQLRVLQLLRQGKLNKQIAFELDVGETTVKAHVSEILRKLAVSSRTQAVIEASRFDFDEILSHHGRG